MGDESIGQLMLDIGADNSMLLTTMNSSTDAIQTFSSTVKTTVIEAGRGLGTNMEKGSEQATEALDKLGRHAKTTVEKMSDAFGNMRWTRLLGMYALLHIAGQAVEGVFEEMGARASLAAADLNGGLKEIYEAEVNVNKANEEMARSIPILGGIIVGAMRKFGDEKWAESMVKSVDTIEKAVAHMEEEGVRVHEEAILEKMRLDKRPLDEILDQQLLFEQSKQKTTLDKAKETADAAMKIQTDLQEKLKTASIPFNEEMARIDSLGADPASVAWREKERKNALYMGTLNMAEVVRLEHQLDLATQLANKAKAAHDFEVKAFAEENANKREESKQKAAEEKQKANEKVTKSFVESAKIAAGVIGDVLRGTYKHMDTSRLFQGAKDFVRAFKEGPEAVHSWAEYLRKENEELTKSYEKSVKAAEKLAKKVAEANAKIAREGQSMTDRNLTAQEKMNKGIEEAMKLRRLGASEGGISEETYQRELIRLKKEKEEADKKGEKGEIQHAGAFEKGSQAAWAAMHKTGDAALQAQKQTVKNTGETAVAVKTIAKKLDIGHSNPFGNIFIGTATAFP